LVRVVSNLDVSSRWSADFIHRVREKLPTSIHLVRVSRTFKLAFVVVDHELRVSRVRTALRELD
jgi:hypothetical protein